MPTTVAFPYLNEVSCKDLKTASSFVSWNWFLITRITKTCPWFIQMTVQAKVAAIMAWTTSHPRTLMLISLWWYSYSGRKFWTSCQHHLSFSYINSIIPMPWLSASSKEPQPERSYFSILSAGHLHFPYPVLLLCCSISKRNKNSKVIIHIMTIFPQGLQLIGINMHHDLEGKTGL